MRTGRRGRREGRGSLANDNCSGPPLLLLLLLLLYHVSPTSLLWGRKGIEDDFNDNNNNDNNGNHDNQAGVDFVPCNLIIC